VLLGALFGSPSVHAHGAGEPSLLVHEANIQQGQVFTLGGDDLDPDTAVAVRISSFGETHPLGVVNTDAEGHFVEKLRVPAGMRDGYALIEAETASGLVGSTWVHVGARPDLNVGLPGAAATDGEAQMDLSVVLLGALLAVPAGLLVYVIARRSSRRQKGRSVEHDR